MAVVNDMRWAKWVREAHTPEEVTERLSEAARLRSEVEWDRIKAAGNYRRRHDKDHRQYQSGKRISMENMEAAS